MKIVLDIDRLLAEGRITAEEYHRLSALAARETGSLAFNILVGFGVLATAGGALALRPSGTAAILLGLLLSAAGVYLSMNRAREWGLLGSMLLLVGSIIAAGGIVVETGGRAPGYLLVTLLYLVGSVLARSGLLAALAVGSLLLTVGTFCGYRDVDLPFWVALPRPAVTVAVFSVLALGSYHLSRALPPDYRRLAIISARTSLFVVNVWFWIGSICGDSLSGASLSCRFDPDSPWIPDWVFAIGWAVGLLVTGVWAARANRRWVVNVLAVFGAIHFYTQYFARLHLSPASVLAGGILALGIALAIFRYNRAAMVADDAGLRQPDRRPGNRPSADA